MNVLSCSEIISQKPELKLQHLSDCSDDQPMLSVVHLLSSVTSTALASICVIHDA